MRAPIFRASTFRISERLATSTRSSIRNILRLMPIIGLLERQSAPYLAGDNGHLAGLREKDYSEQTAREVDLCVRELIDEAFRRARALLEQRRSDLEAGAQLLLERETLTPEDFPALAGAPAP